MKALRTASPTVWFAVALTLVAVAGGIFVVDWDEHLGPGDYLVAVGTLALAIATGLLARHAARQADLTAEALEAEERPFLVGTPHPDHPEGLAFEITATGMNFIYRVWNIGRGPGLLFRVSLQEGDRERELITFDWPRVVTPNGAADYVAEVVQHTIPLPKRFTLRIIYLDGSRATYVTTQEMWREEDTMVLRPLWFQRDRLKGSQVKELLDSLRGSGGTTP